MERIKASGLYGRILLLVLVAMAVIFAVAYPVVISREGYVYEKHILVPATENRTTTYSARVKGEQWCFTVTEDKTVAFRCGEKLYGPYTVKEDPTAIPEEDDLADHMTGVEVRCGDELLFRGGIFDTGSYWIMTNEDGTAADIFISATRADGTVVDSDGNPYDPMKPSVSTVLDLVNGPELTHRGYGGFWFLGAFLSLMAAGYILFADDLFRWRLRYRVRNLELVEPSELELALRPVGWTVLVLSVLAIYIMGITILP